MNRWILMALALMSLLLTAEACNKWEDKAATPDDRINNPYCNDPEAVNYNWGFPGKPDNTTCFYPADLFAGNYKFKDSTYGLTSQLYLRADSGFINIEKISQRQLKVTGLCPGGQPITFTALAAYQANVDTTVGDTTTLNPGQLFCRTQDTVTGYFSRDKVDSSLIYIELVIRTDTGATVKRGRAIKQ